MSDEGPVLQPMRGPVTRSDYVYDELKQAIIEGRLRRGVIYPVATLADLLNVSRTPVREALLQLAREGMVKLERSRGVRIVEPRAQEVQDIFVIRRLLEPWAAREAVLQTRSPRLRQQLLEALEEAFAGMQTAAGREDAQQFWRHDRAFHLAILRASGNQRVAATVDQLREIMLMREATTSALIERRMIDVAEDHRPIVRAIETGDADQAYETMLEHVMHASERVLQHETDLRRELALQTEDIDIEAGDDEP